MAGVLLDAEALARPFLDEVRAEVAALPPVHLIGILGTGARPSEVYADYAAAGCEAVGIEFERRRCAREDVSRVVFEANVDPAVHGMIVFYPVFGGARDRSLQNEVDARKDVEGLHASWTQRLYHDVRFVDAEQQKKTVLPCTPLGIVKALGALGVTRRDAPAREQARGLEVAIFNRSEVVGRPLAAMLAHDGAKVYSFDIDGVRLYAGMDSAACEVTRAEALARADVVVTGVPSKTFAPIRAAEIKAGATCINVSYLKNLHEDVIERAARVLPRVGPITVAMLVRNTVRLFQNFHRD